MGRGTARLARGLLSAFMRETGRAAQAPTAAAAAAAGAAAPGSAAAAAWATGGGRGLTAAALARGRQAVLGGLLPRPFSAAATIAAAQRSAPAATGGSGLRALRGLLTRGSTGSALATTTAAGVATGGVPAQLASTALCALRGIATGGVLSKLGAAPAGTAAASVLAGRTAWLAGGAGGRRVGLGALRGPSLVRTVWQDRKGYTHFEGRGSGWSLSPGGSRRALYFAGALGAGFGAYYVYCLEEVPYSGRRHSIMLVSNRGEQLMGKQLFEEVKAMAAAEGALLPPSHPDVVRVSRIGRAIAAVAGSGEGGGYQEHMKGLHWEFAVINKAEPNAFVVPGGKVVVYRGLLDLLGRNDDELASVMAHEVGHILARHAAERMSTLNVWTLFNMALRLTLGFGLPNVAVLLGIFLPYSRLAESEADQLGLRLMARACFDPAAAPVMLAKLNMAEKRNGLTSLAIPEFLRTHPLTEERVKRVEAELPLAFDIYSKSGCAVPRSAFRRGLGAWPGFGGGGDGGEEVVEVETITFR